MDKREGEVSRFPSKIFCLTVPKNSVGEPFSLSSISGIKKVWMRVWGGSIKIFRQKFLVSECRKHRKGTLHCFTNFGHQKMLRVNRKIIWHDRDSNPEPTA